MNYQNNPIVNIDNEEEIPLTCEIKIDNKINKKINHFLNIIQ